jgi:hypothetical protein
MKYLSIDIKSRADAEAQAVRARYKTETGNLNKHFLLYRI